MQLRQERDISLALPGCFEQVDELVTMRDQPPVQPLEVLDSKGQAACSVKLSRLVAPRVAMAICPPASAREGFIVLNRDHDTSRSLRFLPTNDRVVMAPSKKRAGCSIPPVKYMPHPVRCHLGSTSHHLAVITSRSPAGLDLKRS